MTNHKMFGLMMSAIFNIGGNLQYASLCDSGAISVDGILKDGRKVHFFVEGKADADDRCES